jgi:hypothetical protein
MRALIIGEAQRQQIAALKELAAANVTPLRAVVALAKHFSNPTGAAPGYNVEFTIKIPDGFTVTYTHEQQRQCVCRHLSASVSASRKGPHPAAIAMLMEEFGFINKLGALVSWLEPLGNGDFAINVLEPLDGDIEKLKGPAP